MRYYLLLKGEGECCDYSPIGGTLACNRRFIKIEAPTHEEAVAQATKMVLEIDPENIDKMFLISVGEVLTPLLNAAVKAELTKNEEKNEEPEETNEETDEEE